METILSREQILRRQGLVVAICFIVGFLLATQIRGQASVSRRLQAQSEQDLSQLFRQLNVETKALRQEVTNLRIRFLEYKMAAADKKVILKEASKNLEDLGMMAGLVSTQGSGVTVTIFDENKQLGAYDILDVIEELRAAGAETISVSGHRVTANTYLETKQGSVYINGCKIKPPYVIKAIGEEVTLEQALNLPGGIENTLSNLEGVTLRIEREKVILPAASRITMQYVTPVEED